MSAEGLPANVRQHLADRYRAYGGAFGGRIAWRAVQLALRETRRTYEAQPRVARELTRREDRVEMHLVDAGLARLEPTS